MIEQSLLIKINITDMQYLILRRESSIIQNIFETMRDKTRIKLEFREYTYKLSIDRNRCSQTIAADYRSGRAGTLVQGKSTLLGSTAASVGGSSGLECSCTLNKGIIAEEWRFISSPLTPLRIIAPVTWPQHPLGD